MRLFEYARKIQITYLAFDVLSNNVDYETPYNFYHDPVNIISIIKKYTRRFNICNFDQPFEFSVFVDFEDSFDASTSKYICE